jgi:ferrous iron transport protein A
LTIYHQDYIQVDYYLRTDGALLVGDFMPLLRRKQHSVSPSADAGRLARQAEEAVTMQDLKPGERARVVGLASGDRGYRQRLLAMGLTPGAVFSIRRRAPLGDPVEIVVRNFTLTLRKAEAAILKVERLS